MNDRMTRDELLQYLHERWCEYLDRDPDDYPMDPDVREDLISDYLTNGETQDESPDGIVKTAFFVPSEDENIVKCSVIFGYSRDTEDDDFIDLGYEIW